MLCHNWSHLNKISSALKMSNFIRPIRRALLSVSDKSGLIDLAKVLSEAKIELLSTGGTAKFLREAGFYVQEVSDETGFPEIMDGRVKTLHPSIHGGILAKRSSQDHLKALAEQNIKPIDLLVVNLYPFEQIVTSNPSHQKAIENIDVGGPAMIRAAAKNHEFVAVITSPEQYLLLKEEISIHSGTSLAFRQKIATQAFEKTFSYDYAIAKWMASNFKTEDLGKTETDLHIHASAIKSLRYGENPHQSAKIFASDLSVPSVLSAKQIQGKPLSYNNVNDTDAALKLVSEFSEPTVVIIKHANPCGVASAGSLSEAWNAAYSCDAISAFGGIIATNRTIDEFMAKHVISIFSEVIIAPNATDTARIILSEKPNLRLLLTGSMPNPSECSEEVKTIMGGYLVQSKDIATVSKDSLNIVSKRKPTETEIQDMLFAWKVVKHVKSNAIVYAKDKSTAAIGAGQMSRLDSSKIAAQKAKDVAKKNGWKNPKTINSIVASDAFFPFPDGLLTAIEAGATAVIQPGGSIRDDEVIQAADQAGVAMAFTGIRHFNH